MILRRRTLPTSRLDATVEHLAVERVDGPLLFLAGGGEVGWDEYVEVRAPDGTMRHGVVLDVAEDLTIVEVYEGTAGLGSRGVRVSFTGAPFSVPVSEDWLGRVADGRGSPRDGGPPVTGRLHRPVDGAPINPTRREVPQAPVITGIKVIDGLMTLVRGQKLPLLSVGGLPHLELAIQIASQAHTGGEPFRVVFAGMGLTNSDVDLVRAGLEARLHLGEAVLFLNTADDPPIERLLTPRVALTVAEHLAFELGHHVLVILSDMTSYSDALRQLSTARGEIPSRRGYPAYLFSDLAAIYERCGRVQGREGSITELPVLTMPAGDITHPVPDLTGYITEGQIVLARDLHHAGLYPPVDALSSLSRMMRRGAGPGRTRGDHLDLAAQLLALLAEAHRAEELAALIGSDSLSITEQRTVDFAHRFQREFVHQDRHEAFTLDETLDRAWSTLTEIPTRELTMLTPSEVRAHLERPRSRSGGEPS